MAGQRYPVTAYSLCNALGRTTADVLERLWMEQTGLKACPFGLPFATQVGLVPGELHELPREYRAFDTRQTRIAKLAIDGMKQPIEAAVSRWGSSRTAMVLGTCTGGIEATERAFVERNRSGALPVTYDC